MPEILVASDADWLFEEIASVLAGPDVAVRHAEDGPVVLRAVGEYRPDLVILDFQMGQMGGMATCLDLRLEASAGRLPATRVLILLDRRADVFLARRSDADGWLVKPVSPVKLRRAVRDLLAGRPYRDDAYQPPTVVVGGGTNDSSNSPS